MNKGSARRNDGYGGSVSQPNAHRYSAVNRNGYEQAPKQPSLPALRYALDINRRITYTKGIVRGPTDKKHMRDNGSLTLQNTSERAYATATVWSRLIPRTRHLRSFREDALGNAVSSPWLTMSPTSRNCSDVRWTSCHTTRSSQIGYADQAAAIIERRVPDSLRPRENLSYSLPDQDGSAASRVRAALYLVVASFVLLAIVVCLVIAAFWLRRRYRCKGTSLYSILRESDPDLPAPVEVPSPRPASNDDSSYLSPIRGEGTPALPRKLVGHVVTEPVICTPKAVNDSQDRQRKAALSVTTDLLEQVISPPEMRLFPPSEVGAPETRPVATEPAIATLCAKKKRKCLLVQPSKPVLSVCHFCVRRNDMDQMLAADRHHVLINAATQDSSSNRLHEATGKENCEDVDTNPTNRIRKPDHCDPTPSGLHECTGPFHAKRTSVKVDLLQYLFKQLWDFLESTGT